MSGRLYWVREGKHDNGASVASGGNVALLLILEQNTCPGFLTWHVRLTLKKLPQMLHRRERQGCARLSHGVRQSPVLAVGRLLGRMADAEDRRD